MMARIALAVFVLLSMLAPAGAVERLLDFVSDATVERNGNLTVTETIGVQAEGNEIRRGIFRDFPTTYHRRRDGSQVIVGFQVLSVTRNGNTEDFTLENLNNGVRVRIGSANRILNTGRHEYVIKYVTTRQIGFFADFDELYWNATGTGWVFPIDMAEARITLPDKVPFRQTAIYTGPQGARGRDATIVEQQPGRIVFRTTRPLPPRNGLTVAAAWQKGVVEPPSPASLAGYWLEDNRALAAALFGFVLLLAYYAYAWLRVGRDPPKGTIIPLFAPPGGISPAAARYVDQMSFDNQCFAVAIINLGVKGHLQIVEAGDKTTLKKRSGGQPLTPDEEATMAKLFPGHNSYSLLLDQANHGMIGRARSALEKTLTKDYRGKLFAANHGWSSIGLLLMILAVALVI